MRRGQQGHAILELALSAAVMVSCLAGTFQFGYSFYIYDQLVTAVGNAGRYAATRTYRAATEDDLEKGRTAIRNMVVFGEAKPAPDAAPIVPGLTDHELPALLQAVADAGGRFAGYTLLRLPLAVKDLFADWLERHYPQRKERVLGRVRDMREGRLNDPRFKHRMRGEGAAADLVRDTFHLYRRRAGLNEEVPELSTDAFRRPGTLF